MHNEVYADALSEITVTGPIIRLDLVSMAPAPQGTTGAAAPVLRQRIIMPTAAFADAVELMQKALEGLIESGALVRDRPAQPVSIAQAERPAGENRSPNFAS